MTIHLFSCSFPVLAAVNTSLSRKTGRMLTNKIKSTWTWAARAANTLHSPLADPSTHRMHWPAVLTHTAARDAQNTGQKRPWETENYRLGVREIFAGNRPFQKWCECAHDSVFVIYWYSILLCNIPFSNNELKKKKKNKLNEKLHFCLFKKVDDECELAQNVLWYYLAWESHWYYSLCKSVYTNTIYWC